MFRVLLPAAFLMLACTAAHAQNLLQKPVTLSVQRQPLGQVLKELEKRSGASFSYNSSTVPADSLVSVAVQNTTLNAALGKLLGNEYEYKQKGGYVIIRPASEGNTYSVSGYILDRETGERVLHASVYEPNQLASALTDERGFFRLKLKDEEAAAALAIRHMSYADTFINLRPGRDAELTVSVSPRPNELDSIVIVPRSRFEKFLANLFVSSSQRLHELNLRNVIADKPFQVSLIPGIGTHGRLSNQVVDKVSLNVLGGYSAGVSGAQIGSIFNIVRSDAKYVQAAGVFSLVGGNSEGAQLAGVFNGTAGSVEGVQASGVASRAGNGVEGVQLSGVYSEAQDSLEGVQASGVASYTRRKLDGVQLAGVSNTVLGPTRGIQAAGVSNFSKGSMRGAQFAGVTNIALGHVDGAQIAGVLNIANSVSGLQLGLINIADSSDGYTVGLINIVRHGVHELSITGNEVLPINLSIKTGTRKLYTIFTAGIDARNEKLYGFGMGLGRQIALGKHLTLNPELSSRYIYQGYWGTGPNLLNRADLILSWHIMRGVQLQAGPSFSVYYSRDFDAAEGYRSVFPTYRTYDFGGSTVGWFGGMVGLSFF